MRFIAVRLRSGLHVVVLVLLGLVALTRGAVAQTNVLAESSQSTGLHAERSYFSPLSFEHFDPSNGNVVLSFVDLELPGNAGRPLRFSRTYNTQSAWGGEAQGYQAGYWTFGIEGLAMRIIERPASTENKTCAPLQLNYDCWSHNLPSFLMADGGERRTMWDGWPTMTSPSTQYTVVSTDGFIKYDRQTGTMKYPNGVVAHYDKFMAADGTQTGSGRLLDVADQYGNTVTLNLVGDTLTVTQSLGTDAPRVVTLHLNPDGLPDSMAYDDGTTIRTWTYGYSQTTLGYAPDYSVHRPQHVLETVTPPGDVTGWQFGYGDQQQWFITPQGGRVDYFFAVDTYDSGDGGTWSRSRLASRLSAGDTWTVTPNLIGGEGQLVLDIPGGSRVTFELKNFANNTGVPWMNGIRMWKQKVEEPVGHTLEETVFEYQFVKSVYSMWGQYWGRACPEFRVWGGLTALVRLFRSLETKKNACGRCGKPRAGRCSKERWARSGRPRLRQRPCAVAFYAVDGEKRSS
jgi:hypothetical protein